MLNLLVLSVVVAVLYFVLRPRRREDDVVFPSIWHQRDEATSKEQPSGAAMLSASVTGGSSSQLSEVHTSMLEVSDADDDWQGFDWLEDDLNTQELLEDHVATSSEWDRSNSDFPFSEINPATGLPMIGCFDLGGNFYGCSDLFDSGTGIGLDSDPYA
ncbi:hypothetical protein [Luteimonas sp. e5]